MSGLSDAIEFLKAFHPEGRWVITAINPENGDPDRTRTQTFGPSTCADAERFLAKWNGKWNLYFTVNRVGQAMGKKIERTDICTLDYLHVDIDPRVGEDLDAERARILALLTTNLPAGVPRPTAIVFSGGGYQAFWKLDEPLPLDGTLEKAEEAKLWNVQLERLLGADNCHNIDRIMRLPGTINLPNEKKRKKGRVPTMAAVVDADWSRIYALDCFTPAAPMPSAPVVATANARVSVTIDVSDDVVQLVDVNDLDKHTADGKPLEDRVKRIIQHGHDPLDDKLDGKPKDDRSVWVFDASCALVRRGLPDNVILAVLLDRSFKISDHIYDQKVGAEKYAIRQIKRAKEMVVLAEAEFEVSKEGKPKAQSQHNIKMALAKLGVVVKLDAFRNRMVANWSDNNDVVVDDRVMTRLRLETDQRFKFLATKDLFFDVVADVAYRNAFHPVRDYLDGLAWDGHARLDNWLVAYGGAADTEFIRAVGRLVLIAAVRRVRQPGCKFDEMLVLEGEQGTNKSSALQVLAVNEDWFSDEVPLAGDGKMAIEALAGRWLVEAAELKGMKNSEAEHLKAFLSRGTDRGRLAYDRITSEVPRQCIIIGTTNSEHYLIDGTGNRRFWPVRITRFDLDALRRDRAQLWAEAAMCEAKGESIRLPEQLWRAAAAEQGARSVDDPFASALAEQLAGRWGKIAINDVFKLLDLPTGQRHQGHNRRIGEAMKNLGWRRERVRREGALQYCYINCATQDAPWIVVDMDEKGRHFSVRAGASDQEDGIPF